MEKGGNGIEFSGVTLVNKHAEIMPTRPVPGKPEMTRERAGSPAPPDKFPVQKFIRVRAGTGGSRGGAVVPGLLTKGQKI